MGVGPRSPLAAPPARPPVHGLIPTAEAAQLLTDGDGPWTNGFEVEPEGCSEANVTTFDPCDEDSTRTATSANQVSAISWDPVEITSADTCSTWGIDERDSSARARRLLGSCESHQLAEELWTGTVASAQSLPNRFLADVANVDIVTEAGEVDPVVALACLEQALAECGDCGQRGMIHATPQTVTHWTRFNLVRHSGPLMLSPNGHYIVADAGYPGTSPDGETPEQIDSVWAYATSLVYVRRATPQLIPETDAEAVDRTNNTVTYRASRVATAWWSGCCHAGARIDISACDVGGS